MRANGEFADGPVRTFITFTCQPDPDARVGTSSENASPETVHRSTVVSRSHLLILCSPVLFGKRNPRVRVCIGVGTHLIHPQSGGVTLLRLVDATANSKSQRPSNRQAGQKSGGFSWIEFLAATRSEFEYRYIPSWDRRYPINGRKNMEVEKAGATLSDRWLGRGSALLTM